MNAGSATVYVCTANREVGQLCYMQPLKNVLPSSDGVLYVFYDFETTQNTRFSETAKEHVPKPGMPTTVVLAVRGR